MNIQQIVSKLQSAVALDEDLVTGRVYGARLNSERAAAILAAEMPRWVPVAEKLPELKEVYTGGPKKANVMVFTGSYVCEGTLEETFVKRIPRWKNGYDRGIPVTHWQPLPSPPREEAP